MPMVFIKKHDTIPLGVKMVVWCVMLITNYNINDNVSYKIFIQCMYVSCNMGSFASIHDPSPCLLVTSLLPLHPLS